MDYLGIGLGFIRIVVVPLIVMHRDNGNVCWRVGYGEERISNLFSNQFLLYTRGSPWSPNSAERWQALAAARL